MPKSFLEAKVIKIDRQADRALLYVDTSYYVTASLEKAGLIEVGDTIMYEPYGYNFGFLASVKESSR